METNRRGFFGACAAALGWLGVPVARQSKRTLSLGKVGYAVKHIIKGCHGPVRLADGRTVEADNPFANLLEGTMCVVLEANGQWKIVGAEIRCDHIDYTWRAVLTVNQARRLL